jgi:SAM-dependent methyltransferase
VSAPEAGRRAHESHHEHYEHYAVHHIEKLADLYGAVEGEMNRRIASHVIGPRVLDVGCGFGSLVASLTAAGFEASGVDTLETWVEAGRKRFPGVDLRTSEPYAFGFPDQSFDTVVLKEVIHHILDESDAERFFAEVRRVCRRRLIVFDPNPTWLLRTARKMFSHVDPECSARDAARALSAAGFEVKQVEYCELLGFPLSGGYVRRFRLPDHAILRGAVLGLDRVLLPVVRAIGLAPHVCWRYLVVADVVPPDVRAT